MIAGKETLSAAAQGVVQSQGAQLTAVGQAISVSNSGLNRARVVAAESITGDVGKTAMTIVTGTNRLQVEIAATTAIEAGHVITGKLRPEELIAAPLAAGIRAAEKQFEADAKPLPAEVRNKLSPFYPADVLDAARWTVGSISISIPDLTNQLRKTFQDVENAVTVGHVSVFVRDPGTAYHWWAHDFSVRCNIATGASIVSAYKYITSCHSVEADAEAKAQQAVPSGLVSLGC